MCEEKGNTMAKIAGRPRPRSRAARFSPVRALERVMPFPFCESPHATCSRASTPPSPAARAIGIGPSRCAPSSTEKASLSRIVAQEPSGERATRRPTVSNIPSASATSSGAASNSGTKPRRMTRAAGRRRGSVGWDCDNSTVGGKPGFRDTGGPSWAAGWECGVELRRAIAPAACEGSIQRRCTAQAETCFEIAQPRARRLKDNQYAYLFANTAIAASPSFIRLSMAMRCSRRCPSGSERPSSRIRRCFARVMTSRSCSVARAWANSARNA